jgi:predicted Fe-S protein YdhL (DUF1289 family)
MTEITILLIAASIFAGCSSIYDEYLIWASLSKLQRLAVLTALITAGGVFVGTILSIVL